MVSGVILPYTRQNFSRRKTTTGGK